MSEKLELWDAVKKTKYKRTFDQLYDIISNAKKNIDASIISTLNLVCTVSHFEAGTFWYYDRSGDGLISAKAVYGGADLSNVHLLPGEGVAGKVIETGEPVIVSDVNENKNWSSKTDSETKFETKSMICVPLIARDTVFGCIQLLNKVDGSSLDENDEDLIVNLASEISKLCLKYNILIDEKSYKNVAVLSVGIKELYQGSKKADPETMFLALKEFSKIIEEPIKKYDGVVDKFNYDNIIIYWVFDEQMEKDLEEKIEKGIDVVNESILSACNTAIEIIGKRLVLQSKIADEYNIGFGLSAGITYGPCYIGDIGTKSFSNSSLVGNVVEFAKEIKNVANYGQIYVDEASAAEVNSQFSFIKVRNKELQGEKTGVYLLDSTKQ